MQKGKILPININIDGTITNIEFISWLQYFTYDEKKNLRSKSITDDQRMKLVIKELKLEAIYQKWEKSGSLKKQLSYHEMMSILYQLIGYEKLSETQLNQLTELENVITKEEISFVTQNPNLKKKTAAILFARFIRQFQTNQYNTTGHSITSDSTLFLTEGPSSNFQYIIEIPKKKSYTVITKIGHVIVAKFNGKIGFLSKSITYSFEKNVYKAIANKVNLRLGPSTSHPIIKVVNIDEQLEGRQFNSEWVQITSYNGKAFISSKFVKKVDSPQKNNENKDD
ncbi:SH3 domain-containing protein, partial [Bacillus sp. JJ664]